MKRDSRLSGVLHVLLHMAEHEGPATSEVLAKASAAVKASVVKVLLETAVDLVMVLFLEWQMDEDVRCVIGVSAFCDLNAHPWF